MMMYYSGDTYHLISFYFLVTKSQLYFCRSDKFRDPWEGVLTKPVVDFYKSVECAEYYGSKDSNIPQILLDFYPDMKKGMFINCWHENEFESAAMWDLYGEQGTAIAITSTVSRLKASLLYDLPFYIGRINYLDYDKGVINPSIVFNSFLHKRMSFSHEKEVRVLIHNIPSSEGKIDWDNSLEEMIVDVKITDIIHSVIISPTSPNWFAEVVEDITKRYINKDIEIKKSSLYDSCIY